MAKKVKVQLKESELLRTSEAIHLYILQHPTPDFDIPDEVYVPWVQAIKKLGGESYGN